MKHSTTPPDQGRNAGADDQSSLADYEAYERDAAGSPPDESAGPAADVVDLTARRGNATSHEGGEGMAPRLSPGLMQPAKAVPHRDRKRVTEEQASEIWLRSPHSHRYVYTHEAKDPWSERIIDDGGVFVTCTNISVKRALTRHLESRRLQHRKKLVGEWLDGVGEGGERGIDF